MLIITCFLLSKIANVSIFVVPYPDSKTEQPKSFPQTSGLQLSAAKMFIEKSFSIFSTNQHKIIICCSCCTCDYSLNQ